MYTDTVSKLFLIIQGMPLTPESPEDRVPAAVGLKASEMIKENKESSPSLVNYNNNPNMLPSVQ